MVIYEVMEEFRSWNKKYNVVCVIIKFYVISFPVLFIVYFPSKIGQDIVDGRSLKVHGEQMKYHFFSRLYSFN